MISNVKRCKAIVLRIQAKYFFAFSSNLLHYFSPTIASDTVIFVDCTTPKKPYDFAIGLK